MKVAIGIPARFASTRFPGKPLALLQGRPMIAHVIHQAMSTEFKPIIVATDDERIADVARQSGAEARMTSGDHVSGTDRLAEAFATVDCDIVINIQGDEPLIRPEAIQAVVQPLLHDSTLQMATLAEPLERSLASNVNIVKTIVDHHGCALYFSRSMIPYPRLPASASYLKHIGVYAYRRDFLLSYPSLDPSEAEIAEQLEQLRALHHGFDIAVTIGEFGTTGIDTPEDLDSLEQSLFTK